MGKAKDLKKRVAWYFRKENQEFKTKELAAEIQDVDFVVTDNEVEALLLEAELVKKHQPKFNIQLKSGIRYAYLRITNEKYPRLETTRLIKKGDEVYGPYTSGQARKEIMIMAARLFKLRINKRMTKKDIGHGKIRLSTTPWTEFISIEEYAKRVDEVRMILKGQTNELIKKLTAEMQAYAAAKNYEQAKVRRNQIFALKNISERQKIKLQSRFDQDIINYLQLPDKLVVQLFNINKGVISGRKEFKIKTLLSQVAANNFSEFLQLYYYYHEIPQEIIVPEILADKILLQRYLTRLAGQEINITVPQKGDKLKLLELVKKNIVVGLSLGQNSLLELQNQLSLPSLPRVIECFDVSNLGPSEVVGSMVQFRDGKPDKNNYRRFKIKSFIGQSDFDAMKEIIYRRYYRITMEKSALPDLIMVDGGKPQLSAALSSLRQFGLQVPVIALAKKQEEIFTINSKYSLKLSKKSAGLKLIQRIRDEAHRFAINYHRLLRQKRDFS